MTCIVICSVARPTAGDKEATQYEIARASTPAAKPIPAWPIATPVTSIARLTRQGSCRHPEWRSSTEVDLILGDARPEASDALLRRTFCMASTWGLARLSAGFYGWNSLPAK